MKRVAPLVLVLLALAGCVERKMIVRSEPAEAELWVNRAEAPVGRTPAEYEFTQHGTFAIRLEKEGYLPVETEARVPTPWYSYPVLDFITEILLPVTIRDHHEFVYAMTPRPEPRSWEEMEAEVVRKREAVLRRAGEMREEVMGKGPGEQP